MTANQGHWLASQRLTHTDIGRELRYVGHETEEKHGWKQLAIHLQDRQNDVTVDVVYEAAAEIPMVRVSSTITNRGTLPLTLESVTSWCSSFGTCGNQQGDARAWKLSQADFDWLGEGRWRTQTTEDLFPPLAQQLTGHDPRGAYTVVSTGTWSTGTHAPMLILESTRMEAVWLAQIEHNGAWRWEIGEDSKDGYMALSGPTNVNHAWSRILDQGQAFTTAAASFTCAASRQNAVEHLTAYRRYARIQHHDNLRPHIIFNDYMNTLNGDPTTEKLLPLISAAAEVGVEIFTIDCGWYDDSGDWWASVGEWMPSAKRFPDGFTEVIDAIRAKGMIPGLWLEPEVIGVDSPVASQLPDSAFFQRNGVRVVEQDRYILDLRSNFARSYLDAVMNRLISDYGIGYFKFDYNVSPGAGTDYHVASTGDGMLRHNRAYCSWIDNLHRRFPDLILENCSSGGMREDFAQTSRFEVQSTSDQQDYRLYPPIAASAPMMILPEQAANWAYPQPRMNLEDTAFNLNTTLLGRFFLSGYINQMDAEQKELTRTAITVYKTFVQPVIRKSMPFWPLGLPQWKDDVLALGIKNQHYSLVTLWARGSAKHCQIQIPQYVGENISIAAIFPATSDFSTWNTEWNADKGYADIDIPEGDFRSRTFLLKSEGGDV
ncbi:alpha-galactosidase [Bifidobacterium aquikefiri]|uniref:alpha-galactosidase n=1 Tax=Bifidobacterium aquikefiri TaxID=1653207 RepID=UPI0039EAB79B